MRVAGQFKGHAGIRIPLLGPPLQPCFIRRDYGELRHGQKAVGHNEEQNYDYVDNAQKHFFLRLAQYS